MRQTLFALILAILIATPAGAQTRAIPACTAVTAGTQDAVGMLTTLHAIAQACIAGDADSAPCPEILTFFQGFDGEGFVVDLRTMDRGMMVLCGVTPQR